MYSFHGSPSRRASQAAIVDETARNADHQAIGAIVLLFGRTLFIASLSQQESTNHRDLHTEYARAPI